MRDRGSGWVSPPLTTLAFATVPARIRTEGAAINALMRNLGASIGVAVLGALLDRNTQVNPSLLAQHLTPFSPLWRVWTPTNHKSATPRPAPHLLPPTPPRAARA